MRKIAIKWVLLYFRFFSKIALFVHRPVVIGIAGSVGKTSTKHALYAILSAHGKTVMTKGNSETGVPLGILGIPVEGYSMVNWLIALIRAPFSIFNNLRAHFLIVEMGIDDPHPPKNMSYLLSIVQPDIAVFVAESAAHTMQFDKTLSDAERTLPDRERTKLLIEHITHEDLKMARTRRCTTVIYNHDNEYLRRGLAEVDRENLTMKRFGSERDNDLVLGEYSIGLEQSKLAFVQDDDVFSVTLAHHVVPKEYQEVFAAALLAAEAVGFSLGDATRLLSDRLELPKGRASVFAGIRDTTIIDSSYNASKASVMAFLDLVFRLKQRTGRSVVFCFGDMRELGAEAQSEHQAIAERIPGIVDYLYCIGELTKQFIIPAVESKGLQEVKWFNSAPEIGRYVREHAPEGSIILVKGSQNTIFLEEAIKYLLKNAEDEKQLCRQEKYWVKKWD